MDNTDKNVSKRVVAFGHYQKSAEMNESEFFLIICDTEAEARSWAAANKAVITSVQPAPAEALRDG